MAGRLRGRTGRGWDAAPRQATTNADEAPDSMAPARRRTRRAAPSGSAEDRFGTAATDAAARGGIPRARAHRDRDRDRGDAPPVDPAEQAREICLRQLAARPRTRAELAGVLRQRGIADDVAAEVLDRYGEVGIIDDHAFARAWVTSRHHGRGLAKKALAGELRRKGVDAEVVGAALEEVDDEAEAQTARALVDRKVRFDSGVDPAGTARRLVGMLARKGYPPGLAFRVVRQAMAERAAGRVDRTDAGQPGVDDDLTDDAAEDLERAVLGALDEEAGTVDPE